MTGTIPEAVLERATEAAVKTARLERPCFAPNDLMNQMIRAAAIVAYKAGCCDDVLEGVDFNDR